MTDITNYFTEDKGLASILDNYRVRDSQLKAASFIHEKLLSHEHACIEAPTGSGKTLSYLIPVFEEGRRTIISTKTKQLMYQIIGKDIMIAEAIFGRKMSVARLKGRRNYICHARYYQYVQPHQHYFTDVIDWFDSVEDNLVIEIPDGTFSFDAVEKMTADRTNCTGSNCQYYDICSFYRAKEGANAADIVVTNHHLLMSDISMKAKGNHGGVFDFAEYAVMDEAHALADIFPLFAGSDVSLKSFYNLVNEHREQYSLQDYERINTLYQDVLGSMKEGRMQYTDVRDGAMKFIEQTHYAVEKIDKEEVTETYKRLMESFDPIEKGSDGVRIADVQGGVTLRYIPLDAGEMFRTGLKETCINPIYISATISVKGSFEYFLSELGYEKNEAATLSVPRVFNFPEQAKALIPERNTEKNKAYEELASRAHGSVLIICNSLSRMHEVTDFLREKLNNKTVLSQTDIRITDTYGMEDTVFVGCASFREGVDFAHASVSCVILDKLPFEYPDDLLLKERMAKVEKDGGDPFMDFYLPRAVIFFKQAVGRLLRHEDDRGLWAVMDNRVINKGYGKFFQDVLKGVRRLRTTSQALEYLEEINGKTET